MTRFLPALLVAFATALPGAAPANPGAHAAVDILPGWRGPDGIHMAALRISLDDGWKTYWRAPGEAGVPPRFDWSGSANLAGVGLLWPVPEVIVSDGVTTLGYHQELILPIAVTAEDAGADVVIEGTLAFGICEEICMPLEAHVSGVLPAAATAADARILGALAARPDLAGEAAVRSAECRVAAIADGVRVTAELVMPAVGPDEYVVVEPADQAIWVSEATVRRDGDRLVAEADLVPPAARPFDLDPATLRLTVLSQGRGVDIAGCDTAR